MIDLPTTTPMLTQMFDSPDYLIWGGGGDLRLPGAIEYQHLHYDWPETWIFPAERIDHARTQDINIPEDTSAETLSVKQQRLIVELATPMVTINFLMTDLTWENGPIRQIPGTHFSQQNPPIPADEPEWMRMSTLVSATAGSGIFRDSRAWRGATPNLSREVRAMPKLEYVAPWLDSSEISKTMPYEVWQKLTPHAQRACHRVVTDPGVWPAGAGIMHPLAGERAKAFGEY